MPPRLSVFIDGRNVHYGLAALGWPTQYDVAALGRSIGAHFDLQAIHYYNATPLQKYTPEPAYGRQLRYYAHIDAQQDVIFRRGYLMDAGPRPVEKLVDVMLAVDLALGAYKDNYDVAALVSADGDFEPAVDEVHLAGKKVINFVFRSRRSFRLAAICDQVRYLKRPHFTPADC